MPDTIRDQDTQCAQVLKHMRTIGEITPLQALRRYGCLRLGARIWDLRNGHYGGEPVEVSRRMVEDRKTGKRYAGYSLARSAARKPADKVARKAA